MGKDKDPFDNYVLTLIFFIEKFFVINYSYIRSPPRIIFMMIIPEISLFTIISDWKNTKGYIIQLNKRIYNVRSFLIEISINYKFLIISETLVYAELCASNICI